MMPKNDNPWEKAINGVLVASSLLCFVAVWEIFSFFKLVDLPRPSEVVKTFFLLVTRGDPIYQKTLQGLTLASLKIVMAGSALSCIVAVPLGLFMGLLTRLETFLNTVLELIRPIPPLAWIPIGYVIFAHMNRPTVCVQLMIVFVGAFFPLLVNTVSGVKNLDHTFIDVARSCGAKPKEIITRVVLPFALPSIMTGMRIGLGVAWMSVIAAEFVGGKTGIGYYIWSMYSIGGRTPEIISGMVAIGLVSYLLNQGLLQAEKRLTPWRFL